MTKIDKADDLISDLGSETCMSEVFSSSYFDVNAQNMLGQTPIFKAIMNKNSDMFNLLLDCNSDITKKELMNNESVRDSVFRYCPNDPTNFLSMDFLAPKKETIMDVYRKYEANLLIESLTKYCDTKKKKLIELLRNFRNDPIFA